MANSFLTGRTLIKAEDLKGPRVYSTDLFLFHFGRSDPEESVPITARAIKIKIITKGLVTLNSTYLVSPLGVKLLDAHPDMFDGVAVLPVFRTDKSSLNELITSTEGHAEAGIDDAHLRDHIARLEAKIKQVMTWELGDTGSSYQLALVEGLRDSGSLVTKELKGRGLEQHQIEKMAIDIESLDFSDSKTLRQYVGNIDNGDVRETLKRYAAALYHMIGTGVVRCESGTDLNPLSAFKAADLVLAARDEQLAALSDDAIFLEAFMGYALDTIQASVLPSQIIDSINFEMAHKISGALRTQGFQTKYDEITANFAASQSIRDPQEALDKLDERKVAAVAGELAKAFQQEVLNELPDYQTAIQSEAKQELYRSGADVARAAGHLVPALGHLVTFADLAIEGGKASSDLARLASVRTQEKAFVEAQRERKAKMEYAIGRLNVGAQKKTKLLDAVALLSDIHALAIARA